MNLQKRKVLMNAFFNAQFSYSPLIWMLHSHQNYNKIKHSHERCLRLIQNDKLSSYEERLEKDGSVSIHHKNIQRLVFEIFKIKHKQSPEIISDIFGQTTQHYSFRQNLDFKILSVESVYHGSESISYLGPKTWEIVPAKIKEINSLNSFKMEIRKWVPRSCPYRLCKQYISSCVAFSSVIIIIMSFFVYIFISFRLDL